MISCDSNSSSQDPILHVIAYWNRIAVVQPIQFVVVDEIRLVKISKTTTEIEVEYGAD